MPDYMLDTDMRSYVMKRTHDAVLKKLANVLVGDVCMSVVTKSELLYGVELSPKRRQDEAALVAFLRYVEVLDFPDEAATHYAMIRADLRARGKMIGAKDLFIAAHARSLGLTLITNNTREFRRVPGLRLKTGPSPRSARQSDTSPSEPGRISFVIGNATSQDPSFLAEFRFCVRAGGFGSPTCPHQRQCPPDNHSAAQSPLK